MANNENRYTQDLDDLKWFAKAKENDIKVGTPAFNLLIEFYKQATLAHRFDDPRSVRNLFVYSETDSEASRIRVFKPEIQKGNLLEWTDEFVAIAGKHIKNQLPKAQSEAVMEAVDAALSDPNRGIKVDEQLHHYYQINDGEKVYID